MYKVFAENDPVMVPVDPVPEPEPVEVGPSEDPAGSVSEDTVSQDLIVVEEENEKGKNDEEDTVSYEPSVITVETHSVDSISVNTIIDPNELVSVNSVSLNVISADGLSLNSVSLNISVNYVSNNYIQIISQDSTPFWDKPFNEYTTSEGLLFTIMITLVLGFVSSHLLKGLRRYGNI